MNEHYLSKLETDNRNIMEPKVTDQFIQDIADIKESTILHTAEMGHVKALLQEVRTDVKRINGSVTELNTWKDSHESEHTKIAARHEKDHATMIAGRHKLEEKLWGFIQPSIIPGLAVAVYLVIEKIG